MNLRAEYRLDLIFSGPLISQAAGTLEFGLDTAMQRYHGQPVLNGSLVKGNIRSTLEEFSKLLDHSLEVKILTWFGPKTDNKNEKNASPQPHNYLPQRAAVDFDCFWRLVQDLDALNPGGERTRIAMEGEGGIVKDGSLQAIEDCFPCGGQRITFSGKLLVRFRRNDEKRQFIEWLGKALDYIPAMGSLKGIGFGKLHGWKLSESRCAASQRVEPQLLPKGESRFGICLTPDRPFCLGRPRTPDSNRIVSEESISGNVIKALIAQEFDNDSKKLTKSLCFDDLIISHALPSKTSDRCRPPPLPRSLALVDHAVADMSSVIDEPEEEDFPQAPIFQPDWKNADYQLANTALERSDMNPDRYLMVRTEINQERGISEERRLFSLECVDPHDYVWCADVELCQIPENKQAAVFANFREIFKKGLVGMGKTKATLDIQIVAPFKSPTDHIPPWRDDLYIVTLMTPAKLSLLAMESEGKASSPQ